MIFCAAVILLNILYRYTHYSRSSVSRIFLHHIIIIRPLHAPRDAYLQIKSGFYIF